MRYLDRLDEQLEVLRVLLERGTLRPAVMAAVVAKSKEYPAKIKNADDLNKYIGIFKGQARQGHITDKNARRARTPSKGPDKGKTKTLASRTKAFFDLTARLRGTSQTPKKAKNKASKKKP